MHRLAQIIYYTLNTLVWIVLVAAISFSVTLMGVLLYLIPVQFGLMLLGLIVLGFLLLMAFEVYEWANETRRR